MKFLKSFYAKLFGFDAGKTTFNEAIDKAIYNYKACSCEEVKCETTFDSTLKSLPVGGIVDKEIVKDRGFEKKTALYCANLIAYIEIPKKDIELKIPSGLNLITNLYIESLLIGSIWKDPIYKVIYIVFNNIQKFNGLFDFQQVNDILVSNKFFRKVKDDENTIEKCLNGDIVKVNKIFLETYLQIRESLFKSLKELQPLTIVITGHGFGGGLANLSASDIVLYYQNIHIYTFGSPKVGNPAFSRYIKFFRENRGIQQYFQIRNEDDVITQLPPPILPNFENPKEPYLYQHSGAVVSIRQNRASVENSHQLPVYISALKNYQYSVYFI